MNQKQTAGTCSSPSERHSDGVDGWYLGASRQGASHRLTDIPDQDAFELAEVDVRRPGAGWVVAVADGHGDPRYTYSKIGSRLAVLVAKRIVRKYWRDYYLSDDCQSLYREFKTSFSRKLVNEWRRLVLLHYQRYVSGHSPSLQGQQNIIMLYGTTLLIGVMAPKFCMVGQIGDGDILLYTKDNGKVSIRKNENCGVDSTGNAVEYINDQLIGTSTWSLCSYDAHMKWRSFLWTVKPGDVLILSSDGLSDSYGDQAEYQVFLRDCINSIKTYGLDAVCRQLPSWLDDISSSGSGDDMTLCMVSRSRSTCL